MKINLNIDRLILNGFDKDNPSNIGKIIESELTRLLESKNTHDINLKSHNADLVDGGYITIQSTNQNNAKSIGTSIAKSIYSSLGNNTQ